MNNIACKSIVKIKKDEFGQSSKKWKKRKSGQPVGRNGTTSQTVFFSFSFFAFLFLELILTLVPQTVPLNWLYRGYLL